MSYQTVISLNHHNHSFSCFKTDSWASFNMKACANFLYLNITWRSNLRRSMSEFPTHIQKLPTCNPQYPKNANENLHITPTLQYFKFSFLINGHQYRCLKQVFKPGIDSVFLYHYFFIIQYYILNKKVYSHPALYLLVCPPVKLCPKVS